MGGARDPLQVSEGQGGGRQGVGPPVQVSEAQDGRGLGRQGAVQVSGVGFAPLLRESHRKRLSPASHSGPLRPCPL